MRIIAGTKRGMKLLSPKNQGSRPILDRVKESLFSVLYKYDLPEGKTVADLFSGVGSLGLEALSRGASHVTFVEKDPKVISILEKNIEKADFSKLSRVLKADAFKTGAPAGYSQPKHDLVFVDPPYPFTQDVGNRSRLSIMLDLVSDQVAEDGIVVVRTHKAVELLEQYGQLEIVERRKWGNMAIAILALRRP